MKKTIVIFAVLGGFLLFIMGNIFKAGKGKLKVVEKVEVLQVENQKLAEENKTLSTENKKLKVVADSLVTKQDSLTETVQTLSSEVNNYETKLEKVSKPVNVKRVDVVADKPYRIDIPIETEYQEPEVSSSEN